MKFKDLLKEYGLIITEETVPKKKLIKLQLGINDSFLSACDEITKKNGLEKKIKALNELLSKELIGESALISNDKKELLMLIDDLLDMINNPHIKLSKDQLIAKLKNYREQLGVLEQ